MTPLTEVALLVVSMKKLFSADSTLVQVLFPALQYSYLKQQIQGEHSQLSIN